MKSVGVFESGGWAVRVEMSMNQDREVTLFPSALYGLEIGTERRMINLSFAFFSSRVLPLFHGRLSEE